MGYLALAAISKVPFYVAGLVLAGYAVVLAVIGITQPSFPYGRTGSRIVMGVSFVLVAVTIAMSVKSSAFIK